MASPTYTTRAIVLRKTKMGESDLALTLLAQDGSRLRCVAKGARKPSSSFSSRLELYSEVDLLCARGRSLDIVKEARLVAADDRMRTSLERAAGAACAAELIDRVVQENLPSPRLFDATCAAFSALSACALSDVPLVTAAQLLKTLAFAGFRPSIASCVSCGADIPLSGSGEVRFSFAEGGAVCARCAPSALRPVPVPAATLSWAQALLSSTYAQILDLDAPAQAGFDVLQLCQSLVRAHVGSDLKSVKFLLTSGLF